MANELWMEGWSYNQSDHWAEQANCKGKAFELFEYQEKDGPLSKGMSFRERLEFNAANFELAAEICIECPVFLQCGAAANDDDKMWTVRAGKEPERFREERIGMDSSKARVCQRGHFIPQGGRCKACKAVAMDKRRLAQKGAPAA